MRPQRVKPQYPLPQGNNYVPDDIVQPTRWIERFIEDLNIPQPLQPDKYHRFKSWKEYDTQNRQNDNNIVLIVSPGTSGCDTHDFFLDRPNENYPILKSQNFRHIMRNAAEYATQMKMLLDLLPFVWSGGWSDAARDKAVIVLNGLLGYLKNIGFITDHTKLVFLSHSHGCNMVNQLSHVLLGQRQPIHMIIHFACPGRSEEKYKPTNYTIFIYFYSDGDWVATFGRMNEHSVKGAAAGVAGTIIGGGLTPSGLTNAALAVANGGLAVWDMIANGDTFPTRNGAITIGIRVQVDYMDPYHTSMVSNVPIIGKASIMDSSCALMATLRAIQMQYPLAYSKSCLFDVNIDSKTQKPTSVLINRITTGTQPPPSFEYLVPNNDRNNVMSIQDMGQISNLRREMHIWGEEFKHYEQGARGQQSIFRPITYLKLSNKIEDRERKLIYGQRVTTNVTQLPAQPLLMLPGFRRFIEEKARIVAHEYDNNHQNNNQQHNAQPQNPQQ